MEETRRSCTAPPLQESLLFPFMRQQFSAAPGANTLCSISPHLLCASAAPCHKNTFHATCCVPACASPTGSFLFPAFPCLLCTAHSGLPKASMLPCIPKGKPFHIYCPRLHLTGELDYIHYPYIPCICTSHLPQPCAQCTGKPSAILFITDRL